MALPCHTDISPAEFATSRAGRGKSSPASLLIAALLVGLQSLAAFGIIIALQPEPPFRCLCTSVVVYGPPTKLPALELTIPLMRPSLVRAPIPLFIISDEAFEEADCTNRDDAEHAQRPCPVPPQNDSGVMP